MQCYARNWPTHISALLGEKVGITCKSENIPTLLMVTETFWRLHQPLQNKEVWERKCCLIYPAIYPLIDPTRDRHQLLRIAF